MGNLEHRAGREKHDETEQDIADLKPAVGLGASEPGMHRIAFRHPPHHDEAERHGDSADQQEGSAPAPRGADIIREVPHERIEQCVPETRYDQCNPEPESAQTEADIPDQSHQLPGDIEQGDRNHPPESIGDELRPGNAVARRGLMMLLTHFPLLRVAGTVIILSEGRPFPRVLFSTFLPSRGRDGSSAISRGEVR